MTLPEETSLRIGTSRVERPDVAFFVVCNARDFVALAALINSIRQVGHEEPIYVTDCGLTTVQRQLLDGHVTLLQGPKGYPPVLLKTQGPLLIDPEVAIILDADVILIRPLTDLVGPQPVFFLDPLASRFHPEWSRLGLGPLRQAEYVNGGHYIIPRRSKLLPRFRDATRRMLEIICSEPETAMSASSPFYLLEQDVLAALIATLEPETYTVSQDVGYWPFEGEFETARLLHHIIYKPWLTALRSNPYTRRMTELLTAGPVFVPPELVPRYLQKGFSAHLDREFRSLRHGARETFRGKLGIRKSSGNAPASSIFAALNDRRLREERVERVA